MSKRNREKRTFNVLHAITHALIKDFHCTDEQVELVMHGLKFEVPSDVSECMDKALAGEYDFPENKIILQHEDGEEEHITLTNHPMNCLLHYLKRVYGRDFGAIYWGAITSTPPDFLEYLTLLTKSNSRRKEVQG